MLKLIISSVLFLLISCSGPKPKTLAPEKVSPDIYKVLLENEDVKVLEAVFAPGQSDNMHDHNPMTAYVLRGGEAQITLPDGTVDEREIPNKATIHNKKKIKHQVKNIGKNTMKVLLVEHKNLSSKKGSQNADYLHPEKVSPDVYKVLLENEDVKVLEVVFAPGQSDNMHDHNPMVAYILEGGKVQMLLPGGTVNERKIPSGASIYAGKGQRHKVKNIGENTIKIILVEYK